VPESDTFKTVLISLACVEKWGYNRFWLAGIIICQEFAGSATSILIGYIASGTTTVGSGDYVTRSCTTNCSGTIWRHFPNRIDLGLGRAPGTDQFTAAALKRDDHAAMEFP
jgi:alkanesulfonate monooxygenase SsuD/methylene tetrahydromethanopterin reductase-like flavin-dependent oxidoreductase (luciferase family)